MTISGPTAHLQLMAAYDEAQAELASLRRRTATEDQQRTELNENRQQALRSLAEHYLPELTPEALDNTWKNLRDGVAEILHRKEAAQFDLSETLTRHNADRGQHEAQLVRTNELLDQLHDQHLQLADRVEKQLREDEQFIPLSDRAALAEAALERAEANLAEIDQDAARKLPAYDDSTLFRYLYDQGFGSSDYTRRGFARRMDRWLAKMINYNGARAGYEFLKNTPEQMRKIIAEDRVALDTVMGELQRRRDQVAQELGIAAMAQQIQQAQAQRVQQLEALEKLRAETERLDNELTEVEDTRGTYYREAIGVIREVLDGTEYRELKRRAKATSEITDDQIVAQLAGVDAGFSDLEKAARKWRSEIGRQQEYLDQLGRLIQRFRAARFDSARSQFSDRLDIPDEIRRARDRDDIEFLWNRIRRAHRWGPSTMEKVTNVVTHPMAQVLINAMAHAAAGALRGHARRAGERHADWERSRRKKSGKGDRSDWDFQWGGDSSDDDGYRNRRHF